MTTPETVWIVDWDLPENPPSRRRAFYRRLSQLCRQANGPWERSTQSVMKTLDRRLALRVYALASGFGRSNLYEAKILETSQV